MTISMGTEETFDKIRYHLIIKSILNKFGMDYTSTKPRSVKDHSTHHTHWWKDECFLCNWEQERKSILTTSVRHSTGNTTQQVGKKKGTLHIFTGKEEIGLSLSTENTKRLHTQSTHAQKSFKLTCGLTTARRCKISIHKPVVFLNAGNKLTKMN